MKRPLIWTFIGIVFGFLGSPVFAQFSQQNEPELEQYPEVKINLALPDPEAREEAEFFILAEDDTLKPEVVETLPSTEGVYKDVLILWELTNLDNSGRRAQNEFLRELLLKDLANLIDPGDRINIGTFFWTDLEGGYQTVNLLEPDFVEDASLFEAAIAEAASPSKKGVTSRNNSELYPALFEGVKYLSTHSERERILVVLSAEYPNIFNPVVDKSTIVNYAQKNKVAIYNFRYPIMEEKYNLNDMASSTFGLSHNLNPNSPSSGASQLQKTLGKATQRSLGMEYELRFQSPFSSDGELHQVTVKSGQESILIQYEAPALGWQAYLKNHPEIWIAGGAGILLLLVLLVLLIRRQKRKKEAAVAERKMELDAIQAQNNNAEEKIAQQSQQLESLRQQREREQKAAERKIKEQERLEEEQRLKQEMFAGGKSPRLVVHWKSGKEVIPLPGPVSILGREKGATIVLPHDTISRAHAQLIYQDGKYTLVDLGSTNGSKFQGERVQTMDLRHGDAFTLGSIAVTFYI